MQPASAMLVTVRFFYFFNRQAQFIAILLTPWAYTFISARPIIPYQERLK